MTNVLFALAILVLLVLQSVQVYYQLKWMGEIDLLRDKFKKLLRKVKGAG